MTMRTLARVVAGVALAGALAACANDDTKPDPAIPPVTATEPAPPTATEAPDEAAAKILSSTGWETTGAKDSEGNDMPLTDPKVKAFVGYAYFEEDQTFTMFNLDDTPKLAGDWAISPDGKTRTITAKAPDGTEFTRDVDIVTLTSKDFTYRVYPEPTKKAVYFDIVHTPTNHPSPAE